MTDKEKWKRLHDIIGFTPPLDGLISAASDKISLDVVKLDTLLGNRDKDYDTVKCTYKDRTGISPKDYIQLKFGDEAVQLIIDLI